MVKGVNKQVIVIKAPDPRLFEQAIFILREDAFADGATADQVMREAQQAAKSYVRQSKQGKRPQGALLAALYAAAGAVGATLVWCVALFL